MAIVGIHFNYRFVLSNFAYVSNLNKWLNFSNICLHINYRKERRRNVICCTVIPIVVSIPLLVVTSFELRDRETITVADIFFGHFSRVVQLGGNLQYLISFSNFLRMISIRFTVLGRFLR